MKMNRRAMLKSSASLSLAAPLMGFARKSAGSPEAITSNGPVRGYASGGIAVFKGIRYGADTASSSISGRRLSPTAAGAR